MLYRSDKWAPRKAEQDLLETKEIIMSRCMMMRNKHVSEPT